MHRTWNSPHRPKVSLPTPPLLVVVLLALLALQALAGCGSSSTSASASGDARRLLTQTFGGGHPINSGKLAAVVTVDPTGSKIVTQPVSLSFGGPFQSRGKGRLPESNLTMAIGFQGHTGELGILSTGTEAFVTLQHGAYKLPAANFKQLESGVDVVGGGSSGSSSALSGRGIHPEHWLVDPRIVGTAQVGGVTTEHIHGKLAVKPLLADLSKVFAKASKLSSSTSSLKSISSPQQQKIASEVKNASFDLWTGASDHTIRKLSVTATLPVSGKTRTELGGMTTAKLTFGLAYTDIGQPQTISAPASSKSYAAFQKHLAAVVLGIEGLVTADSSGAVTGSTSTTATGDAEGPDSAYSQCVSAAGANVAKIQKCAGLLNGSSGD